MTTDTIEDYLKSIYQIEEKHGKVATSNLAEQVGVAPATATAMLKKLAQRDLVNYTPYQGVQLTDAGREIALRILRYHRLAELYMVKVLGVRWSQVHTEAHKWEHALSEDVAARMEAALGYPDYDPHGHPIPRVDGSLPQRDFCALTALDVGQKVVIAGVDTQDAEILHYLGELGLYPETVVEVLEMAPFDGPVTVRVNGEQHVLGHTIANKILVIAVHHSLCQVETIEEDQK